MLCQNPIEADEESKIRAPFSFLFLKKKKKKTFLKQCIFVRFMG